MKARWLLAAVLAALLATGCSPDDPGGPAEQNDAPADQPNFDDGY